MTIAFIWMPIANPDGSFGDPVAPAVISGCVFGSMTLLGAYAILDSRRARLFAKPQVVRAVSAFRDRTVAFSDVTRAHWRCRPAGGSLVLYTPGRRVVIEFHSYAGGRDLIPYFREAIPEHVQENYDQFHARICIARRPVVVSDMTTLKLSIACIAVAAVYWTMWDVQVVRMTVGIPLVYCPAIAAVATLDWIRRRRWVAFFAAAIAVAAVACLFTILWPEIAPLLKASRQLGAQHH